MAKALFDELDVPKGMFIFSNPQKRKCELNSWEKHFADKGIATKIIKDREGRYYLCREGKEAW